MSNSNGTPTRTFRIPDELWIAAKDRALIEGVTLTQVVVEALTNFVHGDTPSEYK